MITRRAGYIKMFGDTLIVVLDWIENKKHRQAAERFCRRLNQTGIKLRADNTYVEDDTNCKLIGDASLKLVTDGGFDTYVSYPRTFTAHWDLNSVNFLKISFYAENSNGFQEGSPWIRLKDAENNYFEYQYYKNGDPYDLLNEARNTWQSYEIPLDASPAIENGWRCTTVGSPDMSDIQYIEIHADTWDYGFNLWIDGVSFAPSLCPCEGDFDCDGLPDTLENSTCTDPVDADTDDDGISDGTEDANKNGVVDPGETDPCSIDTDGDGIQDGTELGITDPVADPDGDGPLFGTDTNVFIADADPSTKTDPVDEDSDDDGVSDGVEDANQNGAIDTGKTDPSNPSSYPAQTTIHLKKGFNLIAIPSDVMTQPDLKDRLPVLGDSLEIEKVMVYDGEAGKFIVPFHTLPGNAWLLAASVQSPIPVADHLPPEGVQTTAVHGDSVISAMAFYYRLEPLANFWHRVVHPLSQLKLYLLELGPHFLFLGLTFYREHSIAPLLSANMRKAQKIKCLRFFLALLPCIGNRIRTKFNNLGLIWMQRQRKRSESLCKLLSEGLSILSLLKTNDYIVSPSYYDHITPGLLLPPCLGPQIKDIMQIHIGQKRRGTSSLRSTLFGVFKKTIFKHPCVQPLLDQTDKALICDSMLEEFDQPFMRYCVEKSTNVTIEHMVYLPRQQADIQGMKTVVLTFTRSVAIRETKEISLIDRIQNLDNSPLDNLIFQRRHTQWALFAIIFGNENPTYRFSSVTSSCQPTGEILKVFFKILSVLSPCRVINTWCSIPFQREETAPERVDVVNMVQQRGKSQLLILLRCLTHPLKRTLNGFSALNPVHVLLSGFPFGQTPWLHLLRHRLASFVQRLRSYYGFVRLPVFSHCRRTSSEFSTRSLLVLRKEKHRISRFSRKLVPYMRGVSDRAESHQPSPKRTSQCCLPHPPKASALWTRISRLNTQPARAPVNASRSSLLKTSHDSEPVRLVNPLLYESFIHSNLPV